MQSETAISRELMGKIVDEVFDGAIEDPSVIEEIYAVIKREEAAQSKIDERNPLDLNITQDWFEKRSALEADHEIGAGPRKLTACIDPTPDELAELFKIAHRIPDGWKLVPVAALSAAEPRGFLVHDKDNPGGRYFKHKPSISDEDMSEHEIWIEPLYAAAPAPSVAVKALTLDALKHYFECLNAGDFSWAEMPTSLYTYLLMDGYIPEESARREVRSALSAQVQDVAGLEVVAKAAQDYVDAVSGEPEKDCWDTEDGKEAPGAIKFASDFAWRNYDIAKQRAFDNLRAALPAAPAKQEGGTNE